MAQDLVLKQKFDIFTISETWLDTSVTDTEIEFPGYALFRLDRNGKRGGGLSAYVNQSFKCDPMKDLTYIVEFGLHQLWLKIQVMNFRLFFICTAYRPPDTSLSCFETDFSETLTSALSFNKPIYILGDLNCNVLDANDPVQCALSNFCTCFNLTQMVDNPTRVTEHSRTLIDVNLTSSENNIKQTKVIPNSISDHDIVMSILALKKCRPKPVYVSVRSLKHYNKDYFCEDISNASWSVINNFEDVNDYLNAFDLLFNEILDQHAPIRKVKVRTRPNPFVTEEIRGLIKTRDRWRKLARKTVDRSAWSANRNCKRDVKRELRMVQRSCVEQEIMKNTKDTGNMWKAIRTCIPKKSTRKKCFSSDDKSVANNFNQFFTSVGSNTVTKIKSLSKENNYTPSQLPFFPRSYTDSEQFTFEPVECSLVE
jgi:hypothetical protein